MNQIPEHLEFENCVQIKQLHYRKLSLVTLLSYSKNKEIHSTFCYVLC